MDKRARSVVAAGYDAIGARYRDWSAGSPVRLRFVDEVLRRLRAGSTVVDLGCGPGEPATRLLSERHRALGVDLSAVQLRLARRAAPRATLVRADVTDLALRSSSVDAVVSFYALGHLPPAAHAPLLRSVSGWLRPGGLLLTNAPMSPTTGSTPTGSASPCTSAGSASTPPWPRSPTPAWSSTTALSCRRTRAMDISPTSSGSSLTPRHARLAPGPGVDLGSRVEASNVADALDGVDGFGSR